MLLSFKNINKSSIHVKVLYTVSWIQDLLNLVTDGKSNFTLYQIVRDECISNALGLYLHSLLNEFNKDFGIYAFKNKFLLGYLLCYEICSKNTKLP